MMYRLLPVARSHAWSASWLLCTLLLASTLAPPMIAAAQVARPPGAARVGGTSASTIPVSVDRMIGWLTPEQRSTQMANVVRAFTLPPRGAYESRAEATRRLETYTRPRRFYVARFQNAKNNEDCTHELTYDADREEYLLRITADQSVTGTDSSTPALPVACTETAAGSFTGSNAMGVQRRVRRVRGARYDVALVGAWGTAWRNSFGGSWSTLRFPFPRDLARARDGRIVPMVLFAPTVSPEGFVVYRDSTSYEPTVENPVALSVDIRAIAADEVELLLVDRQTGDVVARSGSMRREAPSER